MKYLLITIMMCFSMSVYADDWPREVLSSEGTITMYQPQIEAYDGNSLKARAAVSIIQEGKDEPVFGAIWITCRVLTDRPTRTVKVEEMEVRRIRFPAGTEADTAKIADDLEEVIPRFDLTFSLDLLLESIELTQKEKEIGRDLDSKPPKIIIMNRPAVLVRIDGNPILTKVEGTSLKRVVNTPYFIVQDLSSGKYFLHGGDVWYGAKKVRGPWSETATAPESVVEFYDQTKSNDETYEDSTANDIVYRTGKIPAIVVSTEPAELIATDGPMQLTPIQGTGLLYVSNTPGRLFLEIKTQRRFILISGRWYTAKSLKGPWEFIASDKLPEDFKNIPPGSECDDVLASVSGTIPAKEAVYDAQIPQMAEVDRSESGNQVEYDGDPQFVPIENTGMDYAVNTSTAVIRVNGRYYDCDQGIWYEGLTPDGPWMVCVDVPEIIYTIPPSYPVYNVRYVRVYHYTPDYVYVGYTAGYMGCYVYNRAIVYGTGYHYNSWYKHRYYARPWTWGFNVHYDPWAGWSFGGGWERQHGWLSYQSRERHSGWWGPQEYHPVYRPASRPVYREGYHPVYRQREPNTPIVRAANGITRTSGNIRNTTLYDNRSAGIRRPISVGSARSASAIPRGTPIPAHQPESRPSMPVTPSSGQTQPQQIPPTDRTPVSRQPESTPSTPATSPIGLPQQLPQAASRPVTPSQPRQPESRPSRPVSSPVALPQPLPVSQPQPQPTAKPVTPSSEPRQPESRPIDRPVIPQVSPVQPQPTPRPQPPQVTTRPSRGEDNVYVAPDGNIMRTTPQGWQQRSQNTWKNADETPAKQQTVHDSEVRQRTAERTSASWPTPAFTPSPQPPSPRPTPAFTPAPQQPAPRQAPPPRNNSDDKNKKR